MAKKEFAGRVAAVHASALLLHARGLRRRLIGPARFPLSDADARVADPEADSGREVVSLDAQGNATYSPATRCENENRQDVTEE